MRAFRRAVAAVACCLILLAVWLPQFAAAEDGTALRGERSPGGERSMLSVVGIGIVCAGGLTALITARGRKDSQ